MSLDPDFYVDSATACFLACFGNTCENHEFENILENRELCKYRILQIRIILGIVFNIIGFIAVVVVNNETYKESNAALGFFILIVTFILIYYGGFLGLTCLLREVFQHFGDETETGLRVMIIYRVLEIEFDIFVLFYSLILSEWEMTNFSIATTILASIDIGASISALLKNCYDTKHRTFSIILIIIFVFSLLLCWFGCFWICCNIRQELPTDVERTAQESDQAQTPAHANVAEGQTQLQENNQTIESHTGIGSQEVDNQSLCANACNISTSFWLRILMVPPTYASLTTIIIGHLDSEPQAGQGITILHKCNDKKSPKEIYKKLKTELETVNEARFSRVVISFGLDVGDNDLDIVKLYMSKTIEKVRNKFLRAEIGICRSKPPAERGQMYNDLNTFIRKLCKEEKHCDIDTPTFDINDGGNDEVLDRLTLRIQNFIHLNSVSSDNT
ncbi:unnamed protein product [Mytilus edulis]|uniref:Uncharacterized protein n=1 Tax=Mytilus edulis TaxID=6550 RepID=A0A8S3T053_MYTED|nr:unnamed protein product [Mytilus edulis]